MTENILFLQNDPWHNIKADIRNIMADIHFITR